MQDASIRIDWDERQILTAQHQTQQHFFLVAGQHVTLPLAATEKNDPPQL
jgi:hypothetical protein